MSIPLASPAPTPSPAVPATCTPGEGDIPDSVVGELLCGRWAIDAPHTASAWVTANWRLVAAVAVILAATRLWWAVARTVVWRRHAVAACWLQITPPVTANPAATVGLWRLLATLLPAPHRLAMRPARLVWEVAATPTGTRCGLWVPPGINPTAVIRVVQRGWPGARIEHGRPPTVPAGYPVAGLGVRPTRPEWQPLLDDPPSLTTSARREGFPPEQDRMRAVYDGLASAGRTGGGLLQVVVGRAPRHRVAVLRRAIVHPERAGRPRGGLGAVALLAVALRTVVLGVLDFVSPGPSSSPARSRAADPYLAEQARQARTKYGAAPHLLIAVRAMASGPTRAAARAAAADITSGYGLLGAHFTRRRVRRAGSVVRWRWAAEPRMALVTVVEAAALAGLPAEPAAYGLPAAASRRRPPSHEVFQAALTVDSSRTACRPAPAAAEPPADAQDDDDGAPVRRRL